jgi:hypothetical protein
MDHLHLPPQQPSNTPAPHSAASSTSPLDPFYSQRAQELFAQYRKDDAHNPEVYAASVAVLFSDYPDDALFVACDPRTGIPGKIKWLPTIAEIKEFLEALMAERHRMAQRQQEAQARADAPEPEPVRRFKSYRPNCRSSLFIPEGYPGYDAAVKRSAFDSDGIKGESLCTDGIRRNGIWVPLEWHTGPKGGYAPPRRPSEKPAGAFSWDTPAGGTPSDPAAPPNAPRAADPEDLPPLEAYADNLAADDPSEGEQSFD